MNIHDVDNPNLPVDKQDIDGIDDFIGNKPNVINVGDEDSPKWLEVPDETDEDKWEADAYVDMVVDGGGAKTDDTPRYFIIRFNDLSEEKQQDIMNEIEDDDRCSKAWFEMEI